MKTWRSDGARSGQQNQRSRRRRHHHATVLAEAIFRAGLKNVTAGANPISLQRGINKPWKPL